MIDLPWPPKELSPNARVHWRKKSAIVKKYKADCYLLCAGLGKHESPVNISIIFLPPDNRHRDIDNMLAACKALLDAVSKRIEVDDRHFKLTIEKGGSIEGGAVRVIVSARSK